MQVIVAGEHDARVRPHTTYSIFLSRLLLLAFLFVSSFDLLHEFNPFQLQILPTCGGDELFSHMKELPKGVSKYIKFAPDSVQKPSSGPTTPQSSGDNGMACDDGGSRLVV